MSDDVKPPYVVEEFVFDYEPGADTEKSYALASAKKCPVLVKGKAYAPKRLAVDPHRLRIRVTIEAISE